MDDPVPETAVIDPLIPPPRKPSVALGRRWRRVLSRGSVVASVALVTLAGVATFGVESTSSVCSGCGSYLDVADYGFGSWGSRGQWLRVWPTTRSVRASGFSTSFLGPDHVHRWYTYGGSRKGLMGYLACGNFERGPLLDCLQGSAAARRLVRAEMDAGRLDLERLEDLLDVPCDFSVRHGDPEFSETEPAMLALLARCEAAAATE